MASSSEGGRLNEVKDALKGEWVISAVSSCTLPVLKDISDLLNTGLDDDTLKVCVQLLEAGVNPEALASVVLELRRAIGAQVHHVIHSYYSSFIHCRKHLLSLTLEQQITISFNETF